MSYFSEREEGERPRNVEEVNNVVWNALAALILTRVQDGSFGASFPDTCTDGKGPIGTDEHALWNVMQGENPSLTERPWYQLQAGKPSTLEVMDVIEFCWQSVGKPIQKSYHEYFDHHHLSFDIEAGRNEFGEAINRIFRRNGLAYKLTEDGEIQRLAPPVLREQLGKALFKTGDIELDGMLVKARTKFLDKDDEVRREALEKLWDAWERLKTLEQGADKKAQVTALLDRAAGVNNPRLRAALEDEAGALTKIGNSLQIRHTETTQEKLGNSSQVDYLFHRLFALIHLLLTATERM